MKCCANCFGDPHLESVVILNCGVDVGECPQCGTGDATLVSCRDLKEYFELVTGIYQPDENGKNLVEWLREDWALFDRERISDANAKLLLAEILDDTEIVRRKFVPSDAGHTDVLKTWQTVRSELMHQNRFFPKTVEDLDLDRVEGLLTHLQINMSDVASEWFRSRIQDGDRPFSAKEMGAPPKDRAGHGRANPAGIPYLYLASDLRTAVSEVRPHPGEIACVAAFSVSGALSLVDLRQPRITVSPFSLSSESAVAQMREDVNFLEHFGDELTRPVVPQAAAIDYIPSQYLCEFIKGCGYDGVVYRSSVGTGINIALFEPSVATIGGIESHTVERVTVELQHR
jgi:hypothetical protein